MKNHAALAFTLATVLSAYGTLAAGASETNTVLRDQARQRDIPVEIRFPETSPDCTRSRPCPVAFLSPGYGLSHTDYRFVSDALIKLGYLAVSIQSVLPGDSKAPNTGSMIADRTPMWTIGADNLVYAKSILSKRYPAYDWAHLVLVGHSNGGDLSALALKRDPALASVLVTLDNRRYPLPTGNVRVLSIRGSDFEADPGVLPSSGDSKSSTRCIVEVADSRHDDMNDAGPAWLKERTAAIIVEFLGRDRCGT